MGIQIQTTVTCDFSDCKGRQNGPSVLTWSDTEVKAGRSQPPPEAQYLVILVLNGEQKAFCCQLCAAKYFLPPGYEIQQKKVIEFPQKPGWIPENGREEGV